MNRIWKDKLYIHFLMEATGLGIFMISAGFFTILLFHPHFQKIYMVPSPLLRQVIIGCIMGSTAFFIITNSWISRSGAHINPAVTLTFLYLGRISVLESIGYIISQFIGGTLGLYLLDLIMHPYLSANEIKYIVTVPGTVGPIWAAILETCIAIIMMFTVLYLGKGDKTRKWTPYFVGLLVSLYAAFESPYSGFGMNPARTFASAFLSGIWTHYEIYLLCPCLGMFLSAYFFKEHPFHPHAGMGKPNHKKL